MLVHPWDRPLTDDEWLGWLAHGRDFGQLVINGRDGWPLVVPTHFVLAGPRLALVHLARPNPLWAALAVSPQVVLSVVDDYAYVPTTWRAGPGTPVRDGVPTSYYAAVQLRCTAEIVDGPEEKAELLRRQLRHFQPDGDWADVAVGAPPYGRLLPGIRGLRLHFEGAVGKFKYDDQKPPEHRAAVAARLQERGLGRDLGARAQQLRRLHADAEQNVPNS